MRKQIPQRITREKAHIPSKALNSTSLQRKPTKNIVKCPACSSKIKTQNMPRHLRKSHATNKDLLKLLKKIRLSVNMKDMTLLDSAIIVCQEVN